MPTPSNLILPRRVNNSRPAGLKKLKYRRVYAHHYRRVYSHHTKLYYSPALKRPCIEFGVVRIDSAMVVCIHSAIIRLLLTRRVASFFFGARIWLGTILGRFSINYFSGLGLRIRVRVWVRVMVRVRVWVRVSVGVGVSVSVVIWSG